MKAENATLDDLTTEEGDLLVVIDSCDLKPLPDYALRRSLFDRAKEVYEAEFVTYDVPHYKCGVMNARLALGNRRHLCALTKDGETVVAAARAIALAKIEAIERVWKFSPGSPLVVMEHWPITFQANYMGRPGYPYKVSTSFFIASKYDAEAILKEEVEYLKRTRTWKFEWNHPNPIQQGVPI